MPINWLAAFTNTYGDAGDSIITLMNAETKIHVVNCAQSTHSVRLVLHVISKFDLEFVIIQFICTDSKYATITIAKFINDIVGGARIKIRFSKRSILV